MGTLSIAFAADSSSITKKPRELPRGGRWDGGATLLYAKRFKFQENHVPRSCGLKRVHSKRNRYLVFQRRMDYAKMNECGIFYPYILRMSDLMRPMRFLAPTDCAMKISLRL